MQADGFNKSIYCRTTTSQLTVDPSLKVIIKNQFFYAENEWDFYFQKDYWLLKTTALNTRENTEQHPSNHPEQLSYYPQPLRTSQHLVYIPTDVKSLQTTEVFSLAKLC